MVDYIAEKGIQMTWLSNGIVEATPIHIAVHLASDENRDLLLNLYFNLFPSLLGAVNAPRTLLHHVALWSITNGVTTARRSVKQTLELLREKGVKMIQMSHDAELVVNRVIDRGSNDEIGILANIKEMKYMEPKRVSVGGGRRNLVLDVNSAAEEIKFIISEPIVPKVKTGTPQAHVSGRGLSGPRVLMLKNSDNIDFDNLSIQRVLKSRVKSMPTSIKTVIPFCVKSGKKQVSIEPIDGLELAILTVSEVEIASATGLVYKEHYVAEILRCNIHSTMEENITAIHLSMIAISDPSLLLSIVTRIHEKHPGQIRTLTIWNETVLHYLLGKASLCTRPLEVLKYCRKCDVRINAKAISDDEQQTADHLNHYVDSKWFSGDQKDEVIRYLRRWREAEFPDTMPVYQSGKTGTPEPVPEKKKTIPTGRKRVSLKPTKNSKRPRLDNDHQKTISEYFIKSEQPDASADGLEIVALDEEEDTEPTIPEKSAPSKPVSPSIPDLESVPSFQPDSPDDAHEVETCPLSPHSTSLVCTPHHEMDVEIPQQEPSVSTTTIQPESDHIDFAKEQNTEAQPDIINQSNEESNDLFSSLLARVESLERELAETRLQSTSVRTSIADCTVTTATAVNINSNVSSSQDSNYRTFQQAINVCFASKV